MSSITYEIRRLRNSKEYTSYTKHSYVPIKTFKNEQNCIDFLNSMKLFSPTWANYAEKATSDNLCHSSFCIFDIDNDPIAKKYLGSYDEILIMYVEKKEV